MEWWQIIVSVCAGIVTVLTLWEKIDGRKKVINQPHDDHELRITKLEKTVDYEIKLRMEDYELRFKRDLERLDKKDKSDKLMMKALLEIMRHEIDGNNTAKLKEVAEELNNFIFDN
jgi:hypothetical protein